MLTNVVALGILVLPGFIALAEAPKQPPTAQRLWSTTLQEGTWQAMNTGSEFAATRQVVFAGDRVVAIFDAGFPAYEGKQPMSRYRLVSLEQRTGQIKNSLEFVGRWGAMPYVFATNDGHVILANGSLKSLNPDLTDAGPKFSGEGRVRQISPDGDTVAFEKTYGGTTLLDSHTLAPTGRHFVEVVPFHGDCGQSTFVNSETVLLVGCGKVWTVDLQGTTLKESALTEGPAKPAGVSQNGKLFALQFSDERGDPSILLYEYFVIFDVASLQPLAMVRILNMPERQSWSAFSPDGKYFVAGNPNDLSFYQLP